MKAQHNKVYNNLNKEKEMSEAINMHKRIAMGGESEANHLKKGGKVKKYAKGGSVRPFSHQPDSQLIGALPEKGIDKLPAKANTPKLTKPMPHSVATMKKGGGARKMSNRGR